MESRSTLRANVIATLFGVTAAMLVACGAGWKQVQVDESAPVRHVPEWVILALSNLVEHGWVEVVDSERDLVRPRYNHADYLQAGRYEKIFMAMDSGLLVEAWRATDPLGEPAAFTDGGQWVVSGGPRAFGTLPVPREISGPLAQREVDSHAFELAFACRLYRAGQRDRRAVIDARYSLLAPLYESDLHLVEAVAEHISQAHYREMLRLHAEGFHAHDAYAAWHAEKLLALDGVAPAWMQTAARRILRDLELRADAPPPAEHAPEGEPQAQARYWVAQLPHSTYRPSWRRAPLHSVCCEVRDALYQLGEHAIWALVDVLDEHEQLIRGHDAPSPDPSTPRTLYTVGKMARIVLDDTLTKAYGEQPPRTLLAPTQRNALISWLESRNAPPRIND